MSEDIFISGFSYKNTCMLDFQRILVNVASEDRV